jgi:hypothetical protein
LSGKFFLIFFFEKKLCIWEEVEKKNFPTEGKNFLIEVNDMEGAQKESKESE